MWSHTGRGVGVDVAAPGHAVWRASVSAAGLDVNAPGSSTGFAASLVAGAGALWLARTSDEPALGELRGRGALTAVARTARAPSAAGCEARAWSADDGPGILDAAALVAAAPRAVVRALGEGAAPAAPGELRALPLFRSLYASGGAGRARADYARLFARATHMSVEPVAHFEAEVLHHYALTREVSAALDAAAAAPAGTGDWAAVRRTLLRQGLSRPLRDALRGTEVR